MRAGIEIQRRIFIDYFFIDYAAAAADTIKQRREMSILLYDIDT